jgi:hypothetical protein
MTPFCHPRTASRRSHRESRLRGRARLQNRPPRVLVRRCHSTDVLHVAFRRCHAVTNHCHLAGESASAWSVASGRLERDCHSTVALHLCCLLPAFAPLLPAAGCLPLLPAACLCSFAFWSRRDSRSTTEQSLFAFWSRRDSRSTTDQSAVDRHLVVRGIRHTMSAAIVTSLSADTGSGPLNGAICRRGAGRARVCGLLRSGGCRAGWFRGGRGRGARRR